MTRILTAKTTTTTGQVALDDSVLGRGGEGTVHKITNLTKNLDMGSPGEWVAKMYHQPGQEQREQKIAAMLARPPATDAVAWPVAALYEGEEFVGYVMKRLPLENYQTFSELSAVMSRRRVAPTFDLRYAFTTIANLAVAIDSVHQAGHMLGDLNESNILVAQDATVMIVDTDSAQISDGDTVYPCAVGKPEYTAPELSHGSLREQRRTPETEMFAFMVLAYQMLTGGSHPTRAIYTGSGEPMDTVDKIRASIIPALNPASTPAGYKTPDVIVAGIPENLQKLMVDAYSTGPSIRPTFATVIPVLTGIVGELQQCPVKPYHWFVGASCPWCPLIAGREELDVFAPALEKKVEQASLPNLDFNTDTAVRKPARRVSTKPKTKPNNPAAQPAKTATKPPQNNSNNRAQQKPNQTNPKKPKTNTTKPTPTATLNPPEKPLYKNKYTVIDTTTGNTIQRPPLTTLIKGGKPNLAYRAIEAETPQPFLPIWTQYTKAPRPLTLLVGTLIAAALVVTLIPAAITLIISTAELDQYLTPTLITITQTSPIIIALLALITYNLTAAGQLIYRNKHKQPEEELAKTSHLYNLTTPTILAAAWSIPMFLFLIVATIIGIIRIVVADQQRIRYR